MGNHDVWTGTEVYVDENLLKEIDQLLAAIRGCPIGNLTISEFFFVQENPDIYPKEDNHFYTDARRDRLKIILRKLG